MDYTTDAHVNLTIAHELRHLWQFKNEFVGERFIGNDDVNSWDLLPQEVDADAFAIAYYTCYPGDNVTKDAINKYVLKYSDNSEAYIRRVELSNKIIREIKYCEI